MKSTRQFNLVSRAALVSVVLYMLMGPACADSGPSSQKDRGPTGQWSRVERVNHYSFVGSVLEDTDLSGIACLADGKCLVGADEGRAVQLVELSRTARTLKAVRTIPLLPSGKEIDIEAIAAEGDTYYIVGSHGISKKQGEQQVNRFRIFRVKLDLATGVPAGVNAAALSGILRGDPVLGDYFETPLQQHGVNIEGLAVRHGRLFVGFRNPNLGGSPIVMENAATDDIEARPTRPSYVLHKLRLGEGFGIREIVATENGFLIIAGNAGSEPSEKFTESEDYDEDREFSLAFWDGKGSDVHRIGVIPNTPGKAEAMTILEQSPSEITVLILFDGPKGGQPTVYRIY